MPVDLFNWGDLVFTGTLDDTIYVAYGEEETGDRPNDTDNKFRYTLQADLSKTFARNYQFSGHSLWRHSIIPRVQYLYTPDKRDDNIPQIDRQDYYNEINRIRFSMLTFLSNKGELGHGHFSYSDLLRLKIQQDYNFEQVPTLNLVHDMPRRNLSDLYGEVDFRPFPDFYMRYDTTYNFYGDGFRTHNVRWHYTGYLGSTLDLDYRYHKVTNVNELNCDLTAALTKAWSFMFHIKQNFEESRQIESRYALRYQSTCWAVEGKLKTDSDDTAFLVNVELLGIGGWGTGGIR
jgi:LPS-assembly protein